LLYCEKRWLWLRCRRRVSTTDVIKVSIVEDNRKIRESLAVLLNGSGFSCVSSHDSAEEACKQIPIKAPDVALVDINLPGMSGIACARKLRGVLPHLKIVMHTVYEDTEKIFDSLRAGANGYLLKRTPPAKLLECLSDAHKGYAPMSPEIARMVVDSFHSDAANQVQQLTDREQEVLSLLTKGYRNKEIADLLKVGLDTVRAHLRNIYEKLHVNCRTEAALKFLGK